MTRNHINLSRKQKIYVVLAEPEEEVVLALFKLLGLVPVRSPP